MNNPNVHLDWDNLTDSYMAALDANDIDTMREVAGQIKISPSKALVGLQVWGKNEFLALGTICPWLKKNWSKIGLTAMPKIEVDLTKRYFLSEQGGPPLKRVSVYDIMY